MVLTFEGFFRQQVLESATVQSRVRYVNVMYFLEDDSITIMEPRILVEFEIVQLIECNSHSYFLFAELRLPTGSNRAPFTHTQEHQRRFHFMEGLEHWHRSENLRYCVSFNGLRQGDEGVHALAGDHS